MKKINIFCILLLLTISGFSQQLTSFDEIYKSLISGKSVYSVFHYKDCQLISDNEIQEKVPDAVGGMPVEVFEYFAKESIRNKEAFFVYSESKLIKYPKGDGYVLNYVKVKVSEDNKVKITAEYLDPITYEVKMTENFFTSINDGKNKGGAYFYVKQ